MARPIRTAAGLLVLAAIAAAPADGPKLGETFQAAVARAAKDAEAIEKVADRATALAKTGNARALAGDNQAARADLRKASEAATTIDDPGARADAFTTIGLGLSRAGDKESAQAAFREAARAGDASDGPMNGAGKLADVALAQARGGDKAAARETFAEAFRRARAIEPEKQVSPLRTFALSRVFEDHLKAGFVAESLRMAEETKLLQDQFGTTSLLGDLERALTFVGRDDRRRIVAWVHEQADAMKGGTGIFDRNPRRDDIVIWIARAEAGIGDFDAAARAAESIGEDEADAWRLEALTAIEDARARVGDKVIARDHLRDLFNRAYQPNGRSASHQRILEMVRAQVHADDLDGAERTASALADEDNMTFVGPPKADDDELVKQSREADRLRLRLDRARALVLVAGAKAARGDAEGARQGLRQATDVAESSKGGGHGSFEVWSEIVAARARAGDLDGADKAAAAAAAAIDAFLKEAPKPDGQVAEEGQGELSKAVILIQAIDLLLKADDRATALRLIDADTTGYLLPNRMGAVAVSHARAGDVENALKLVDRLTGPALRASALLAIAEAVTDPSPNEQGREKKAP